MPFFEIAEPLSTATTAPPLLEALSACAELNTDLLHSSTAGTTLHLGPGVVVIRDLVHAGMLLELAAAGSSNGVNVPDADGFGAAASAAHATLLKTTRSAPELA